jgi:hypothetical protein
MVVLVVTLREDVHAAPVTFLFETSIDEACAQLVRRIVRVVNQLVRLRALLACCAAECLPSGRRTAALTAACAAAAAAAAPDAVKRKVATSRTALGKFTAAICDALAAGVGGDVEADEWAVLMSGAWGNRVPGGALDEKSGRWELLFAKKPFPMGGRVSDRVKHERSKISVVLAPAPPGEGAATAATAMPPPAAVRPKRSRAERRREKQQKAGGRGRGAAKSSQARRHEKWVHNPNAPPPPPPFDVRRLLASDRVIAGGAAAAAAAAAAQEEEAEANDEESQWRLPAAKLAKVARSDSIRAALRDPQLQEIISGVDATEPHRRQAALQKAMGDPRVLKFVDELLVAAEVCTVERVELAGGGIVQQLSFVE